MYSNVPTGDLLHIIDLICGQQLIEEVVKNDLINMAKIVLEQNYFQFENNFYSQKVGLAMGSSTSSILSEMYLQYKECTDISDTLIHNNIIGYFCYVDDILVVYDKTLTNIDEVLNSFNRTMPTMKSTIEKESENMINFLDITVRKEQDKLKFKIYRKHTATDAIIPFDSCHPTERNMAAVRYLTNRMNKYHLNTDSKEKERDIIKHILQANKYDTSALDAPPKTQNKKTNNGVKWAKFTYAGKERKFITKLFSQKSITRRVLI
jgi:hypothetical protein